MLWHRKNRQKNEKNEELQSDPQNAALTASEDAPIQEPVQEEEQKQQNPKKKRERRPLSYYFKDGLISAAVSRFVTAIYNGFANGIIGRAMCSYSVEQSTLESGYIRTRIFKNPKLSSHARSARRVFARGFEDSLMLGVFKNLRESLLCTTLKNYGNYLLSFGLYTVFVYFVRQFVSVLENSTTATFLSGMALIFAAIPLLGSRQSLAEALGRSVFARALLVGAFGIREEVFEHAPKQSRLRANLSIILGMACGTLTFIVPPAVMIFGVILVIGISFVITVPEAGVVSAIFLIPFFSFLERPSAALMFLTLLSAVSYLIKLIRGKRIIVFEIVDFAVLAFMILVFLSGTVSVGGMDSFSEALLALSLMLIYFLVSNMMRTEAWINRCVIALVSSATVVALVGIYEYYFGDISQKWLDLTYFSGIKGRVVSLFDNANVLAFFLVMAFPFALSLLSKYRARRERFLVLFASAAIVLCVVFTYSRGAWLGFLFTLLIYALIMSRRTVKVLIAIVFAIPLMPIVIPESIIQRFLSIGDLSDSSTYYRVLTWRASTNAFVDNMLGGIGFGSSAYKKAYPAYAYAGIEGAEHSHNLFLQIGLGMGIFGLVIFLVMLILFSQKSLEFIRGKEKRSEIAVVAASLASFAAALVMGMFDYIFYNNRILFLFFAVMGIGLAAVRVSESTRRRHTVEISYDKTVAALDLDCSK